MYTRSRNSQGGYSNGRGTGTASSTPGYQNPTYPGTQANFVPAGTQVPGQNPQQQQPQQQQQGNYKSSPVASSPQFKPATPSQQQQQQQPQQIRTLQGSQTVKPQAQPAKPATQPQQQQLNPTPQQPRLKPILKQPSSAAIPSVTSVMSDNNAAAAAAASVTPPTSALSSDGSIESGKESMDVDNQDQPKWKRSRVPGFKVNKKLKRLRMNQRLRRALQPKNAIMVLNEMKTGVQFTFPETQTVMANSLFVVHAEIEGKTYVGQGLSKPLARQNAAENALKCLLLEKMTTATSKARIDAESDGQLSQLDNAASQMAAAAAALKEEMSELVGLSSETTGETEQDEVPWSSLASFALYKLFLEWQNQGTVVPVPRPGVSAGRAKKEPKAPIEKELPINAITIHPVMLLNQMKPGLTYSEVNRMGNPPNTMFTLAVEIDGIDYNGTAKNKKDAKKAAAKTALTALYGLVYPEESNMDHTEDIMMC